MTPSEHHLVPPPRAGARRARELDGIRGLAAATVVVTHLTIIFPAVEGNTRSDGLSPLNVVKYSPLHALFGGNQAVLLFFVLSGFVLALPFAAGRAPTYGNFLIRRVARIYVPYLFAVALAFTAAGLIGHQAIPALSPWSNGIWRQPVTFTALGQHVALIDQFPSGNFDPVLWSLVHEMRLSLIFPLLVALVTWAGPWRALGAGVAVAFVAADLNSGGGPAANVNLSWTAQFSLCFIVGIVIARHRQAIIDRMRGTPSWAPAALTGLALVTYTYVWWMPRWPHAHLEQIDLAMVTAGAAGFIIVALASPAAARFLKAGIPQFLGRISYSLYLLHAIVLLALLNTLYGKIPLAAILALTVVISVLGSTLAEMYVERPAIALGRRLTAWSRRPAPARAESGGR